MRLGRKFNQKGRNNPNKITRLLPKTTFLFNLDGTFQSPHLFFKAIF